MRFLQREERVIVSSPWKCTVGTGSKRWWRLASSRSCFCSVAPFDWYALFPLISAVARLWFCAKLRPARSDGETLPPLSVNCSGFVGGAEEKNVKYFAGYLLDFDHSSANLSISHLRLRLLGLEGRGMWLFFFFSFSFLFSRAPFFTLDIAKMELVKRRSESAKIALRRPICINTPSATRAASPTFCLNGSSWLLMWANCQNTKKKRKVEKNKRLSLKGRKILFATNIKLLPLKLRIYWNFSWRKCSNTAQVRALHDLSDCFCI